MASKISTPGPSAISELARTKACRWTPRLSARLDARSAGFLHATERQGVYAEAGNKYSYGYCPAQLEGAFLQGYSPAREIIETKEHASELERRISAKKKELREARDAKNSASHIAYVQKDLRDLQLELVQLKFKLAQ